MVCGTSSARLCHLGLGLALRLAATADVGIQSDAPSILLDTSARLPPSGFVAGAGIEDVNNELYGGVYSQLVHGESFEEPASNGVSGSAFEVQLPSGSTRPTWMPWSATGFFGVSPDAFQGKQSQFITDGAIANFGLGQQGMHFLEGRLYEGYVYVKAQARATVVLKLISDGSGVRKELARQSCEVGATGEWTRLNITLVPSANTTCGMTSPNGPNAPRAGFCGYFGTPLPEIPDDGTPGPNFRTCYQCSGGLVIEASGAPVLVDAVFLQPGAWGRYKGMPVRRDVAEVAFGIAGWQVIRLGGTMCEADEYRWKGMRGFPRRPYRGSFHPFPSASFAIFEVLALCEATGVECAITVSNNESPLDLADFVEYCHGGTNTHWGALRATDGHPAPYKPFTVEIGNEQILSWKLVEQVQNITRAMSSRGAALRLPFPLRFAVGQNLDLNNFKAQSEALNITRGMLEVLRPYGPNAAWDAHIGGDGFKDSDDWLEVARAAQAAFKEQGGETKLVVFEENGFTHNLQRALVHSRMHIVSSYLGGFVTLTAAANGFQVFGQNDNSWDQGQIFMTPDAVWLSPYGWSQSMLSLHSREFRLPVRFEYSGPKGLDIGAYASDNGSVGLRIVNWALGNVTLAVRLPWSLPTPPVLEAQELTSSNLTDVNYPWAPRHVAPQRFGRGFTWLVGGGFAAAQLPLAPRSLVTVSLRPTDERTLLM